jgi:hypothetical protein
MGWFHATPVADKQSKQKQLSRAEKIRNAGGEPLMPPCDAQYMIGYWHDLGLYSSGAMGALQISSIEIKAWAELSAVELDPWEFNCLRQMSKNYIQSLHDSESVTAPPPFGTITQEFDRNVVQQKITSSFKAFISASKKP